jgi:hypothetical protein
MTTARPLTAARWRDALTTAIRCDMIERIQEVIYAGGERSWPLGDDGQVDAQRLDALSQVSVAVSG